MAVNETSDNESFDFEQLFENSTLKTTIMYNSDKKYESNRVTRTSCLAC